MARARKAEQADPRFQGRRHARHGAARSEGDRRKAPHPLILGTIVAAVVILVIGGVVVGRHLAESTESVPNPMPTTSTVLANPVSSAATRTNDSGAGPAAPNPSATLSRELQNLLDGLEGSTGIVLAPIGGRSDPVVAGEWAKGPAWSTSKIPLAIAALRALDPPEVNGQMRAAITESDNAAAEALWEGLGDPTSAAGKVQEILRSYGDPTVVESQRIRPEFTAFGQTMWPLVDQAHFVSAAACDPRNDPIFALMGEVEADQQWGLGVVTGAQLKGGWGPDPVGAYLVRQFGIVEGPSGRTAVAIAVAPSSGSFGDGTQALTQIGEWLNDHLAQLPGGQCPPSGG